MVALVVPVSVPLSAVITAACPGGGDSGAVNIPVGLIVPWHGVVALFPEGTEQSPPGMPFTYQVMLPTGLPAAVAVNACEAPAGTTGPLGEICRVWDAVTFTIALPVEPCDMAMTVSGVAGTDIGAVYTPVLESIVPAPVTDQVTVAGVVPPTTLAVKVCIWPTATLGFDGETVTVTGPVELPLLPQPTTPKMVRIATAIGAKNLWLVRISVLHSLRSISIFTRLRNCDATDKSC